MPYTPPLSLSPLGSLGIPKPFPPLTPGAWKWTGLLKLREHPMQTTQGPACPKDARAFPGKSPSGRDSFGIPGWAKQLGQATLLTLPCLMPAWADGIRLWEPDVAVATASGDQGLLQPVVVADGNQGAFILWHDRPRSKIYLRLLDSDGRKPWPAAPLVALTAAEKFAPAAIRSGQDGVIVAWAEGRTGGCKAEVKAECDLYVQKFDHAGQRLWSDRGRPLVRAPGNQGVSGIALAPDGQGGVFAAWEDARPACCKVYAQHLDRNGHPLWAENGLRISPEPFIVFGPLDSPPRVVSDGEGGVLIAWIDNQVNPANERSPLKIQRLDAKGNPLWPEGGLKVGEPSSVYFSVAPDMGGGALLGFTLSGLNGIHDAAAQKVTPAGTTPWGAEGVRAGVAGYYHLAPEVVSDSRGGAFLAWVDYTYSRFAQEDGDIRLQHLLQDGRRQWSDKGRVISDLPGMQDSPRILRDGKGGAFLFWRDCRDYWDRDACYLNANLYGQHIRPGGSLAWASQGAPISKAGGSQGVAQGTPVSASSIAGASDLAGGALLAWPDGRIGGCDNAIWTTECDVRAQRVADDPNPPLADLALQVEATHATESGLITLTLQVSNLGPDSAGGVKLLVPDLENVLLPPTLDQGKILNHTLYYTLGTLPSGQHRTRSLSLPPLISGNICFEGKISAETLDPVSTNNQAKACVEVP